MTCSAMSTLYPYYHDPYYHSQLSTRAEIAARPRGACGADHVLGI